jgi:hypothetical protein
MVASVPEFREAPERQAEAPGQLLGDRDRLLGRLGEVGAAADPPGHRGDHPRVGVADQHHPVAAVQVDVLVAVDVPDPAAGTVADPDRLRAGDLPAGGDPAGQRPPGPLQQRPRAGLAVQERLLLLGDQLVEPGLHRHRQHHRPVSYPISRATPRLASWLAMIARWISEVPSQMRSTAPHVSAAGSS